MRSVSHIYTRWKCHGYRKNIKYKFTAEKRYGGIVMYDFEKVMRHLEIMNALTKDRINTDVAPYCRNCG